ncbi:hypothetical protein KGQ19_26700 [Catenulispora sp. NL8]|uniref:Uncharacterized protein n=1 Tax=Catenulispora pinistramenti TaxID=2705254 RepID=A0ABS5KWS5_9ACTN|nr:hypothetical protein [Catenulispora pinistramenti]MBS2550465.1 hypothetical protein [Catenulispora pinistramenti]
MTEHTPGGETLDQDQVGVTEKIQRSAAVHGADLTDPMTRAGFLGSMAALLALTQAEARLPEDQARIHAQAILDLVDALGVDTPNFNAGWDALLAVHASMMNNAVKAGTLNAESKDVLFDAAARLLHNN